MKISELIAAYGDDNVQFQILDDAIDRITVNKGTAKITFGAEQPISMNGPDKLGLVIWLDRARVNEIIAAEKDKNHG